MVVEPLNTPASPKHKNDEAQGEQLLLAAQMVNQGDLIAARDKYVEIQHDFGDSPQVLMPLGLIEGQLGDLQNASEYFSRVTQIDPAHIQAWMALALCLHKLGKIEEAIHHYKRALQVLSQSTATATEESISRLFNECLIQLRDLEGGLGRFSNALIYADQLNQISPDINSCMSLSRILLHLNDYSQALRVLEDGLATYVNDVRLYILRGIALEKIGAKFKQGDGKESALDCYEHVIKIDPSSAQGYYFKANLLSSIGRWREAIVCYEAALRYQPNHLLSLNNALVAYQAMGEYTKAQDCITCFLTLVNQNPALTDQLDGGTVQFFFNAGALSLLLFDYSKARVYLEIAISQNALHPQLLGAYLHLRMRQCDWQSLASVKFENSTESLNFEDLRARFLMLIKQGRILVHPFSLLSVTDDAQLHRLANEKWSDTLSQDRIHKQIHHSDPKQPLGKSSKIRVGYFSCDFKEHATAYLIASLFEYQDKDIFEIFAYSWSIDDQSIVRSRIKNSFDYWFEVSDICDSELVSLARSHKLDIAIDLKGYTEGARTQIFADRVAPVQIAYLGYPGKMYADFIDYCIADEVLVPVEAQSGAGEQILYMPRSYQVNDCCRPVCETRTSRLDHGLPEHSLVFCAFNSTYKITPEMFDTWMQVLKKTPNSVLWLIDENTSASNCLKLEAQARGVDPQRLVFAGSMPNSEHIERMSHADLFLDTYPCNAHTTASDALWSGVPIVTLMGDTFASRVASSLLTHSGLSELITNTLDQYLHKVLELALDSQKLKLIKSELRSLKEKGGMSLFDTKSFTKDFENVLKSVTQDRTFDQA